MQDEWKLLEETAGMLQAELVRSVLEAQGIMVTLVQEGAGRAMGMTFGSMGAVQILVPASSLEAARQVLVDYNLGDEDNSSPVEE